MMVQHFSKLVIRFAMPISDMIRKDGAATMFCSSLDGRIIIVPFKSEDSALVKMHLELFCG